MVAQVFSILGRLNPPADWTRQEISEFYRVESALIQAGLEVETDRGVTDDGDPWFVFCRRDNGEVFIHFARVKGEYIVIGASLDHVVKRADFPALVREVLATQSWAMARVRKHANVVLHPAGLLIALVAGAFFHSSSAKAAETSHQSRSDHNRSSSPLLFTSLGSEKSTLYADASAVMVSSVLIGLNSQEPLRAARSMMTPRGEGSKDELFIQLPPAPAASAPTSPAQASGHTGEFLTPPSAIELSVLATRPSSPAAMDASPGPAPAMTGVEVHAEAHPALAAAAAIALSQSALTTAMPSVLVEMGTISSDEAGAIIFSSGVLARLAAYSDGPLPPPPIGVANLIASGAHVAPATPVQTAPGPVASGAGLYDSGGAGSGVTASSTLHALHQTATDATISAAVSLFASEVHGLDVSIKGDEIVLYDAAILGKLPPGTTLSSVTFELHDGSSISLVGTTAELQNLHLS